MPTTVFQNEGKKKLLERIITVPGEPDCYCILFQNNIVPNAGTVYSDLTIANFSGYKLSGADTLEAAKLWPAGTTVSIVSDKAVISSSTNLPFAFIHDGGGVSNTIYGLGMILLGNILLATILLDSPKTMAVLNDTITLTAFDLNLDIS